MREGITLDMERQILKNRVNVDKDNQEQQLTKILQTSRDIVDSVNKK